MRPANGGDRVPEGASAARTPGDGAWDGRAGAGGGGDGAAWRPRTRPDGSAGAPLDGTT